MAAALEATKICPTCKTEKSLKDFYRDRSTRDGYSVYCRTCKKKRVKKNYLQIIQDPKRAARLRILGRVHAARWYRKNPKRACALSRARAAQHPEQTKAQSKLQWAITIGVLVKPPTCSCCNHTIPARVLHAHHHDYGKPLEVEWLCALCHKKRHRIISSHSLRP